MAAVGISESLDMRSGGGNGGKGSRGGILPPPPPLLVSAGTGGSPVLERREDNGRRDGMMMSKGKKGVKTTMAGYHQNYQNGVSGYRKKNNNNNKGEEMLLVVDGDDDDSDDDGDLVMANEESMMMMTTAAATTLKPAKFNIFGKMQIMPSKGNDIGSGINSNSGSMDGSRQSNGCNRADKNKSLGSRCNNTSSTGQSETPKESAGSANKSGGGGGGGYLENVSAQNKRSATLLTLKNKLQGNAAVKAEAAAGGESPLDFSTKKVKLEDGEVYQGRNQNHQDSSATSRLRNILSMKDGLTGILNLSKGDVAFDGGTWSPGPLSNQDSSKSTESRSESRGSSSNCSISPDMSRRRSVKEEAEMDEDEDTEQQGLCRRSGGGFMLSPKLGAALNLPTGGAGVPGQLNFTPFGSVFANSNLSSLSQNGAVGTGPLHIPQFDATSQLFPHHIGAASPTSPFDTGVSPVNGLGNGGGGNGGKARATRPFKAYPKDPLSFSAVGLYGLPLGTTPNSTEALLHQQSQLAYAEFRKQMLNQSNGHKTRRGGQRNSSGGAILTSPGSDFQHDQGANSSAEDSHSSPEDTGKGAKTEQQLKDEAYWERRRKNNEAAKRSRDARRAKEDEIAIRAAFLEQENLKLRYELCALKNETAKLRCLLYSG